MGAGEGAFFVAEELALQKGFRDGAAIDGDEGSVLASAALVNGAGGHFLAGAAFAQKEHRGVGGGDLADGLKDRANGGAVAHHAFKGVVREHLLHLAELDFQGGDIEAAFDDQLDLFDIDRFAQEIVSARADGAQGDGFLALAGDDNDLGEALQGQEVGQGGQTFIGIGGTGREAQVKQNDQGAGGLKGLDGAGAVFGQEDVVVLGQPPLHLSADFLVVIDDEQFLFHAGSFWSGKSTLKTVPFCNSLSTSMRPP